MKELGNMKPWQRRQVKRQIEALQSAGLSHLSDTEPSSEESADTEDTSWTEKSEAKNEEALSCHMSFHFQLTHPNFQVTLQYVFGRLQSFYWHDL